ncbi:Transporter, LysE family [Candidatus Paraburkholderia schumanniana]|nr:Transporter, LysE family [Candidatus Paraburkholderia schumannianae]
MPTELLNALPAAALFTLVTTITPGPNNTMLLASGVNFGLKRTVPHVLGISAGMAILMIAVGLGLSQAFERLPWLYTVLEAASVAYLLYLAWKIGTSSVQMRDGQARPMRFELPSVFRLPRVRVMQRHPWSTEP